MFEKWAEKMQNIANGSNDTIDPSRFGDPVAKETAWNSAKTGGPSGDKLIEVTLPVDWNIARP